MKYRPEIDGLRAVAVLTVILFHAGSSLFSGGYVGVDVFFVISGYLITTIILNEKEAGKFTIARFYERRARRILPALSFVMLACLPFAWRWMQPVQLEEFSKSMAAVALFISNIAFWYTSGYFAATAELKPLLHTWSLAVEEQYYLLFPLFIILMWRFGKRMTVTALVALGSASLLLAQWGSMNDPSANFYLLPTRLWEILIGSLTAFYLLQYPLKEADQSSFFSIKQIPGMLGLGLILYSILSFDEKTPFPSFYALLPTVGTALIILFAPEKTLTGRILSNKVFVGIGLISYSAYLWHQPLFAFARIRSVEEPDSRLKFALGILTLVLAYLTWKYVETPFRHKNRFDRKMIFQFAAGISAFFVSLGMVGYLNEGFENRIAPSGVSYATLNLTERMQFNYGLNEACTDLNNSERLLDECRTGEKPNMIVWGDSVAMHLTPGILASRSDAQIAQMTKGICGPVVGIAPTNSVYPLKWAEGCLEFNNNVLAWLQQNPSIRYAVLSSSFRQYLLPAWDILKDGKTIPADEAIALASFESTLETLVAMGIKPIIFTPPPADTTNIGDCLAKSAIFENTIKCQIEVRKHLEYQKASLDFLEKIDQKYQVVWFRDELCGDTYCEGKVNDVFIYRDGLHLSIEGSEYLGKKMNFYELITSQ